MTTILVKLGTLFEETTTRSIAGQQVQIGHRLQAFHIYLIQAANLKERPSTFAQNLRPNH